VLFFSGRVKKMTLYERIRYLRKSAGMTQDDLAHLLGYKDRSMIAKIEAGKVDLPQSKITEIADVLDTTPGYLMGWVEAAYDEAFLYKQESKTPKTPEARILAKGIDKMPQAQREAIISMMQGLYPGLFEKGTEEDET
jgi:transcriptional regulator with XRE-family HTH domain